MENESNKKIVQDIMPKKRSIRDIELPSRQNQKAKSTPVPEKKSILNPFEKRVPIRKVASDVVTPPPEVNRPVPEETTKKEQASNFSYRYDYDEKKGSSKKVLYIFSALLVLVVSFGISALFKGAKITITPKNEVHTLTSQTIFSAKKDDTSAPLSYQIVTISKDLEKAVSSDSEQQVSKKATGTIVIYNNTTQSQKLVATTRFETPEGLIFRLINPATVPASQVKDGKTIPGSVEAVVEANEPGVIYNIGLADFTIPGFKGSSKYTQIFAKSKTTMTGGFVGMQKVVSKDVISATDNELKDKLKSALIADIALQIPDNFVLYKETLSYDFSPISDPISKGDGVILQKRATAKAVIFDKGSLSRAIVSKILPEAKDDMIKISNLDSLIFVYKDGQSANLNTAQNIDFSLSGDAKFVWVFDENKLKADLAGLSKKQAMVILSNYKSIKEAWVETSPFWNQTIPKELDKVKIVNTLSK